MKGRLLLSVSPPFWDFQDEEDPAILEIICEERQKLPEEAFIDFGPILPNRYDVDQLKLMVQSPLRVFAYWELRETTILMALSSIPVEDRQNFQLFLKWKEMDVGRERCLDAGTAESWWFDTLPEIRYQLELGLYWGEYGWLPLLVSGELVTPRLALGPASDGELPHTQAFLEDLVQQTGIGLPHDTTVLLLTELDRQPSKRGTRVVDGIASSEEQPEKPFGAVTRVGPSWTRPTSSW